MPSIRRYARAFWVVAIVLLAAGQLAHGACADKQDCCESQHPEHSQSESGSSEDSSDMSQQCCHSHSPANVAGPASRSIVTLHLPSGILLLPDEKVPDPPIQEIDYPPQLS